jgi:hypothetical protein
MEVRVDVRAVTHLVNSVLLCKDGKQSVDAVLMECCRCHACGAISNFLGRLEHALVTYPLYRGQRACAGGHETVCCRACSESRAANECGWPVDEARPGGRTCVLTAKRVSRVIGKWLELNKSSCGRE